MHYFDNLVVGSFVDFCVSVGDLFLAPFIGIDSFWMGIYILIVILGCFASIAIPARGKRRVR